jgi:hypothetical protein
MAVGAVAGGYKYTTINSNTTTTIMSASGGLAVPPNNGTFGGMIVGNAGTSWRIQIYDGTAAQADLIIDVTPTAPMLLNIPCQLENGLTVVTSGTTAGTMTVFWV